MPDVPIGSGDLKGKLNDSDRRLRAVERLLRENDGFDPLQTFENGSPLGDTRYLDFGAGIRAVLTGNGQVKVSAEPGESGWDAIVDHDSVTKGNVFSTFQEAFDTVGPQGSTGSIRIYLRTDNGSASETVSVPDDFATIYIEGRNIPTNDPAGTTSLQMASLSFVPVSNADVYQFVMKGCSIGTLTLDASASGSDFQTTTLTECYIGTTIAGTGLNITSINGTVHLIDNHKIRLNGWSSNEGVVGTWMGNHFDTNTVTIRPNTFDGANIVGNRFTGAHTFQVRHTTLGTGLEMLVADNSGVNAATLNFNGVTGTGTLWGRAVFSGNNFADGEFGINSFHALEIHVIGNNMGTGGMDCGTGGGLNFVRCTVIGNDCAYVITNGYNQNVIEGNYLLGVTNVGRIRCERTREASITGNVIPTGEQTVNNRGAIFVELENTGGVIPSATIGNNIVRLVGGSGAPGANRFGIEVVERLDAEYAATINSNAIVYTSATLHADYTAIRFGNNGGVARLRAHSNVGRTGTIVRDDSGVASVDNSFGGAVSGGGGSAGTGPAPVGADYLVGTAQAGLSAEIVVGATPGGELGNTWASPTVDATHSGSAHTDFIAKAFMAAKGDLITATANDTPVIKTVGADGTQLYADSTQADGLRWGAPVPSASVHDRSDRTSGNLTLNSTTWANVDTGLDLVLAAAAGDWVEVGLSAATTNGLTAMGLDAVSLVAGAPVNNWSKGGAEGAAELGVQAWVSFNGLFGTPGGSIIRQLVAGDISGGNVTIRLRYRTAAAVNKVLTADTNQPLTFWGRNLGQT